MIPLPLYLAEIGLPDVQIGIILGAMGITSLVIRPISGSLADSQGRKIVMLGGTAVLVIGTVSVPFTTQPILLFSQRILQATGYVAFTTAATALMSDLAPAARRASALAVFGIAANIAMTTVPAGVSALLPFMGLESGFWLAGGLALLGGLLVSRISEPPLGNEQTKQQQHGRGQMWRLAWRLRTLLLLAWLFGLGFGAFFQFLPLLTERRGVGTAGLLYTTYGLTIIGTRLLTGRWLDQWPPRFWLALGFTALSGGLTLLAAGTSYAWFMLAVGCIACGSGVLHPLLISLHVQPVTATERGRAGAVFYLGFDLGIGLGLWLMSPVIAQFGLTGLFATTAVVTLAALLPTWLAPFPNTSHTSQLANQNTSES